MNTSIFREDYPMSLTLLIFFRFIILARLAKLTHHVDIVNHTGSQESVFIWIKQNADVGSINQIETFHPGMI